MTGEAQAILMFHGIGEAPNAIPQAEIPYWITEEFFDEILMYVNARQVGPEVVMTFDDGNASDLTAATKLSAIGQKGIFFVLAGRLDTPGYLSCAELRELDALGMEIGLHGTDHVDWRRVSRAELIDETVQSRKILASVVGKPIQSVAIPYGAYNKSVIRHLNKQDFDRVYLADNGIAKSGLKFLRRNPVMAWQTISDIDDYVEDRAAFTTRLRRAIMPFVKRYLL